MLPYMAKGTLRICKGSLSWGDFSRLPKWAKCITGSLREAEGSESERHDHGRRGQRESDLKMPHCWL